VSWPDCPRCGCPTAPAWVAGREPRDDCDCPGHWAWRFLTGRLGKSPTRPSERKEKR
jgi:hypothetical protein